MKIKITSDDIARGVPKSGKSCPIARAIKRKLGATSAFVGVFVVTVTKGGEVRQFLMGWEGALFVKVFDCGAYVEPTTITLLEVKDGAD